MPTQPAHTTRARPRSSSVSQRWAPALLESVQHDVRHAELVLDLHVERALLLDAVEPRRPDQPAPSAPGRAPEGHRLARAAALELERPEAVPGADLQYAHAVQALRDPVVTNVGAQVEPAVGDLTVAELQHVVPALVAGALEERAVSRHGAAP